MSTNIFSNDILDTQDRVPESTPLLTRFREDSIFWIVLIIWVIPLMFLCLFYFEDPFDALRYFLWLPLMKILVPFSLIIILTKYFFTKQEADIIQLWTGPSHESERLFVSIFLGFTTLFFVFVEYISGIFLFPLLVICFILIMILWKKGLLMTQPTEKPGWREYFTRLNTSQRATLIGFFVILPVIGIFTTYFGIYFGYLIIFLFIGAVIINANLKPKQIGLRYHNPILIFILAFLPVLGQYLSYYVSSLLGLWTYEPEGPIYGLIYLYLIVGVAEELLWRVFVQTYMERQIKANYAVILTAIAFALWHLPLYIGLLLLSEISPIIAIAGLWFGFGLDLMLGYLWYRTRSLPVVTLCHLLANLGSSLGVFAVGYFF
ncbi:MAG: CPBP family intramembrane glutamic endopeptidase [Promethearchaeota archaeon]